MRHAAANRDKLPWTLLGVHAARMDMGRDPSVDESIWPELRLGMPMLMALTDKT